MTSRFMELAEAEPASFDFGSLRWMSNPSATEAGQLTAMDVTILPGKGHSFHKHPDQEEVIYVVSGEVEQWVEQERRILKPGDAVFIAPGVVHASFQAGKGDARIVVVFGPCVGDGFEAIEMADEAPWNSLRA
jgi:quercetin dioxygenase-like cupin family protein